MSDSSDVVMCMSDSTPKSISRPVSFKALYPSALAFLQLLKLVAHTNDSKENVVIGFHKTKGLRIRMVNPNGRHYLYVQIEPNTFAEYNMVKIQPETTDNSENCENVELLYAVHLASIISFLEKYFVLESTCVIFEKKLVNNEELLSIAVAFSQEFSANFQVTYNDDALVQQCVLEQTFGLDIPWHKYESSKANNIKLDVDELRACASCFPFDAIVHLQTNESGHLLLTETKQHGNTTRASLEVRQETDPVMITGNNNNNNSNSNVREPYVNTYKIAALLACLPEFPLILGKEVETITRVFLPLCFSFKNSGWANVHYLVSPTTLEVPTIQSRSNLSVVVKKEQEQKQEHQQIAPVVFVPASPTNTEEMSKQQQQTTQSVDNEKEKEKEKQTEKKGEKKEKEPRKRKQKIDETSATTNSTESSASSSQEDEREKKPKRQRKTKIDDSSSSSIKEEKKEKEKTEKKPRAPRAPKKAKEKEITEIETLPALESVVSDVTVVLVESSTTAVAPISVSLSDN